ncbi:ABC transporter permease subunit [Bacillus sp. CGMCC 1.16607]|uniref:ABC transporter permease subunit n=1 Tax=Bacillus sp. CGMCC 1.16607 TaxID=3351842 RepID=UPI00362D6CB9
MKLIFKLIGGFFIWLLITIVMFLIILIPRDAVYQPDPKSHHINGTYKFSWDAYKENINQYYQMVIEKKSFGETKFGTTVEEELFHYMKRTLTIIIPAFIISISLGILKGMYDYRNMRSWKNWTGSGTTWLFQSVPDFFIIISVQYGLILLMRQSFPHIDIYGYDKWYNTLLPIFFLSLYPFSYIASITSIAMSNEEGKDYIITAKAKGMNERIIIYKHMLWNCWSKILSQFLTITLILISSSIIVEYLTFYRGAGKRLLDSLQAKSTFMVGQGFPVEVSTVVGFSFGFMILILVSIWIQLIISHYLVPTSKEVN